MNILNTLALTTSLLTGTEQVNQKYVYEADLTIQQLDYNRNDYVKADFSNTNDGKYVHISKYKEKQNKVASKLKKQRIAEREKKRLAELAKQREIQRQLELKRLEQQRLESERQKQIEQAKLDEQRKQQEKLNSSENITNTSNNVQSKQKQSSNVQSQRSSNKTNETKVTQSKGELFQITYYTAFCSEGCTGVTASGHNVSGTTTHNGMKIVAADPRFSLGTKLRVTYNNGTSFVAIVLDRGGAIHGNILDVLVSNKEEARRLGRTTARVEVIN